MAVKTEYKFKPALLLSFLTPLYDLGGTFGSRKKLHEKILSQVVLKNNWKILDVGCGTGEDLILLNSRYPKVKLYGIDADSKILDIAKKKTRARRLNINFCAALAEKLPFKDNSFNAVWCSLTLHHLPTEYKKQALREMYRVLRPKGRCYLVVFSRPKNPILAKIASIQNLFEHTKDNYEGKIPQFVKQAGFKQIKESKIWLHVSLIQAVK